MVLTQVSRHWRDAAVKLHSLWNFIRIKEDTPLTTTSLWLERSGARPLDIVITSVDPSLYPQIYQLLIPHLSRWRSFHMKEKESIGRIRHQHPFMFSTFLKVIFRGDASLGAPKLEVLELWGVADYNAHDQSVYGYISLDSPALTRLVVMEALHEWAHFSVSFTKITHFRMCQRDYDKAYFETLMRLISQMVSLQNLQIEIEDNAEPEWSSFVGYQMTLLDLAIFSVRINASCPLLWAWLTNLNAPRLRVLHVWHESRYDDDEWHENNENRWEPLLRGIQLPFLEDLYWMPDMAEPCGQCLTPLLPLLPSLTRLDIEGSIGTANLFTPDILLPLDGQFPCLKSVNIRRWRYWWGLDKGGIIKEIEARIKPPVVVTIDNNTQS
ncbi:hypothetical protein FRC03_000886 [Tulasnella sp. 419]|nr:hypothetical protein FRC03_000886 [Tulasnella sp. 419]